MEKRIRKSNARPIEEGVIARKLGIRRDTTITNPDGSLKESALNIIKTALYEQFGLDDSQISYVLDALAKAKRPNN